MRTLKTLGQTTLAGVLLVAMGAFAVAQQPARDEAGKSLDTIRRVSNLLDADVHGLGDKDIADLSDLMMDYEGRIHYVVLGAGGLLGIGEDHVAVPFQKVQTMQRDGDGNWTVTIPMTQAQLERAPTVKKNDFTALTSSDWMQKNNQYFEVKPAPEGADITLYRASSLIGAKATNSQGDELASVDDLLLDAHGRAVYAILGSGGILGIGEDHLAIPFKQLNLSFDARENEVKATLNTTREKLEGGPRMQGNDYDQMKDADYVVKVTRYYVVENPDTK